MPRRYPWARWPATRLLQLRLSRLGLTLEGTWLDRCVERLYAELDAKGIRLRPHVWLSDEWFAPSTAPGFAIPFYLSHPRLMRLERSQIFDVEGGSLAECMRIMRHETGHAIQHAYLLNRRRRWQTLFGKSSTKYPRWYRPNPASKRYVQHLRLWYAQAHPDEDFAETFAVWLRPRSDWKKRYAGWPALQKLEYVDELMRDVGDAKPIVSSRQQVDPLRSIRKTLAQHYEARRKLYTIEYPETYDRDLHRIFSSEPEQKSALAASTFLRKNRRKIRRMVARWTGEYQLTLDHVLEQMIGRCRALRLRAVGNERQLRSDFAVLLTVHSMHSLYSQARRSWIPL
ncbi:MAG TPA: putative zinc-binding metallopeptidase [Gemmatimonadales bacterium]